MITAVLGQPGHGKSLYAAWLINELAHSPAYSFVATNVALLPAHPAYKRVLAVGEGSKIPVYKPAREKGAEPVFFWDFLTQGVGELLGKCALVLDEYDKIFPSGGFEPKHTEAVHWYHSQHRKHHHDVWVILQELDNLHVRIRRQVDRVIWCENTAMSQASTLRWLPKRLARLVRYSYSSRKCRPKDLQETNSFLMSEAEEIYGWYRTDQLIRIT